MHFHQLIHQYLLEYRENKNSDFNFLVRQRASTKDKNYPGGKFAQGLVFQGTNSYCFVALVDRSGGANATKSVGVVVKPRQEGFKAYLEIVFPGEEDEKLIGFYRSLALNFENVVWDRHKTKAKIDIGTFPQDDPKLLLDWLDKNYQIIQNEADNSGIINLIPDKKRFVDLQQNLKVKLNESNIPRNYWIFQGSPEVYDITNALKAGHLKSWKVAAHKDKIKIGDQVIIWQTGEDAGCYALAEVISDVNYIEEQSYETSYYVGKGLYQKELRVQLKVIEYTAGNPVLWKDIKEDPIFKNFKAGNQGTNFTASYEEYSAIHDYIVHNNSFLSVKNKFETATYQTFINNLKDIIIKLQLDYNDDRVVYSVTGTQLNFIIGQRYSFNLFLNNKKGTYGIISIDKWNDKSESFNGKTKSPYYNYLDKMLLDNQKQESVFDAMSMELKRTTKSSYYRFNNTDFQNEIFDINKTSNTINSNIPLNQILYGPPGTGKTYKLQAEYFDKFTVNESNLTKEQYIENLVDSYTWWQVIAMAILDLEEVDTNGIMNHELIIAKSKLSTSNNVRPIIWSSLQSHTVLECENVKVVQRIQPLIFEKNNHSKWSLNIPQLKEFFPEAINTLTATKNFSPSSTKNIKNYEFVTFHQSFTYEDFVEGIKPVLDEEETDLRYEITSGVFKRLANLARNNPSQPYAIFIDEINRGNVASIFGELITLIETDKRAGAENELSVVLPYSKTKFSVSKNLHIIGTMNTADRSIEALDSALRRRFEFIEMLPDYDVIDEVLDHQEFANHKLSEILKTINNRIIVLIDRDHQIGHSYFLKLKNTKDLETDLKAVFMNKIIPLLQEYFFNDYIKIAMVIGEGFMDKNTYAKVTFAQNDGDYDTDYNDLVKYEIRKEVDLAEAISLLMGTDNA